MIELPEGFDSIFRYVVVASQRAEQLIHGAKPRIEPRHGKPTLVACDEVDAGLVSWRVLTQQELDAQRQAIVEQFRAEMAGEETQPERARAVPDVLPTRRAPVELEVEERAVGERDDELTRLQRLLGMVGGRGAVDDIEPAEEEEVDPDLVDADEELVDDEQLLDVDDTTDEPDEF